MLLAVVVLALMVCLLWIGMWQRVQPEPVYQGKPLSYWLEAFDPMYARHNPGEPAPPTWTETHSALHQMGSNALPELMRIMRRRDSRIKESIIVHLERYGWFRKIYRRGTQKIHAVQAFGAVGDGASNAVPGLIDLFEHDHSAFIQQAVPAVIGDIGPPAIQALPAMMGALAHTNAQVRCNAIYALRQIHARPEVVVPELIKALKDPDTGVRLQAMAGLESFGRDASNAVPALIEMIEKEHPSSSNVRGASSSLPRLEVVDWSISPDWPSAGGVGIPARDPVQQGIQTLRVIEPDALDKLNLEKDK